MRKKGQALREARAVAAAAAGASAGEVAAAADALAQFEGLPLDDEAHAAIAAALEACAARAREAYDAVGEDAADYAEANPNEPFVALPHNGREYRGALEPPVTLEESVEFIPGEMPWEYTGAEVPDWVAAPEDEAGQ